MPGFKDSARTESCNPGTSVPTIKTLSRQSLNGWHRPALAALLAFSFSVPARAGKLDLDIYGKTAVPFYERAPSGGGRGGRWVPGDPRDVRGAGRLAPVIHGTYTGLAVAGAIGCATITGGGAAVVGFGIVGAVNLWLLWKSRRALKRA